MLVSVIIANHNGERFLPHCLQSVFQEKGDYEVIVVDDGSTDQSLAFLKNKAAQEKRLRLIALGQNRGAAEARNIGVKNSQGEYLFFLDNDTKIKKGWLKPMIKFFHSHPQVGVAQAKLLKMGTNRFDYAGDYLGPLGFLIERARSAEDKGQFNQPEKIFALKSAAMVVRRTVFEKLGGFDPDYQIFWEDTDFCWRGWLAGYQVWFLPEVIVWHAYGTPKKGQKIYLRHQVYYRGCRNNIATLIKNLGRKRLVTILPLNLVCWLVLACLFFLKLDFPKGWALLKGIAWNLWHLPQTWEKRKKIQQARKISDEKLFTLVGAKKEIGYYLGKALAYARGKPF